LTYAARAEVGCAGHVASCNDPGHRGIEKGFIVKNDEDADLLCQLGVSASAVARMLERH